MNPQQGLITVDEGLELLEKLKALSIVTAIVFLLMNLSLHADQTEPGLQDTDGDGYLDGPNLWVSKDVDDEGVMRVEWTLLCGEDKNGNGKYEPEGADGALGTFDDESDPNNPTSYPEEPTILQRRFDTDGDGIPDFEEDLNKNGIQDNGEFDWLDADTDDDGLTDGFENYAYWKGRNVPFTYAEPDSYGLTHDFDSYLYSTKSVPFMSGRGTSRTKGNNPDSDGDGLPDGLEVGITEPHADTDTSATFLYMGQNRPCYVPDLDPKSITDPGRLDTNFDGVPDGDQDLNYNGRLDAGEFDPAFGWIAYKNPGYSEPTVYFSIDYPLTLMPKYRDGKLDPHESRHILRVIFQNVDDTQPQIKIGDDEALQVRSVNQINDRIWSIELEWKSERPQTEIWFESPSLVGGSTPRIQVKAYPLIWLPPTPVNTGVCRVAPFGFLTPPWFILGPIDDITMHCLTPIPLSPHWRRPILDSRLLLWAFSAWGGVAVANLTWEYYYGIVDTMLADHFNGTTTERIEKQWLLACIYAEAIGGYGGANYPLYQKELLLFGITPIAQLSYVYARPGPVGEGFAFLYCRIPNEEVLNIRDGLEGHAKDDLRVYDIIGSRFYGTFPIDANERDPATGRPYNGNDRPTEGSLEGPNLDFQDLKWMRVMDFNADAVYGAPDFAPQWRIKDLDEMKVLTITNDVVTSVTLSNPALSTPGEKKEFLRGLLRAGISAISIAEGRLAIQGGPTQISANQTAGTYLHDQYHSEDNPYSHRPPIDYGADEENIDLGTELEPLVGTIEEPEKVAQDYFLRRTGPFPRP